MISLETKLSQTRERTAGALAAVLADFVERRLPNRRIARLAGLLALSNVELPAALASTVAGYVLEHRQPDHGWVDCEDTAWSLFVLRELGDLPHADRAETLEWLRKERAGEAWGYCLRDAPCIPITATLHWLFPELADAESTAWFEATWARDLKSEFRLSYKAAWYLLAQANATTTNPQLMEASAQHLGNDQRDDGGWGPWKHHPAPTCAFSTGIATLALARLDASGMSGFKDSLERSSEYFRRHAGNDGLFPTHYIEEGSAWLLAGFSETLKVLRAPEPAR